jgi:hypothetical protein
MRLLFYFNLSTCLLLFACNPNKEVNENHHTSLASADSVVLQNGSYITNDRTGTLTITEAQSNKFTFSLSVVTENANCTGEISGIANKAGSEGWTFNDQDTGCALTFKSQNRLINVAEVGESGTCDHGASCSFAATYQLANDLTSNTHAPKELRNIIDYFLALPDSYFNCEIVMERLPDQRMSTVLYQNVADGYLLFKTEELDTVQLALFNGKSGHQYLAYVYECGSGCQCNRRAFLNYDNGVWNDIFDQMVPDLSSVGDDDTSIALRLPEKGTTITIYDYDSPQKSLGNLVWKQDVFELQQ